MLDDRGLASIGEAVGSEAEKLAIGDGVAMLPS